MSEKRNCKKCEHGQNTAIHFCSKGYAKGVFVKDRKLCPFEPIKEKEILTCYRCGGTNINTVDHVDRGESQHPYTIYKCANCNHLFIKYAEL